MTAAGSKLDRPSRDAHLAKPRARVRGSRPAGVRLVGAAAAIGVLLVAGLVLGRNYGWFGHTAAVQVGDHSERDASDGARISEADAHALESKLANNPADIDTRVRLVGYYFSVELRQSLGRVRSDQPRTAHVAWLIEHKPALEVLGSPYGLVEQGLDARGWAVLDVAWMHQIESQVGKAAVLGNGAFFYSASGDFARAQQLYGRAHAIEPSNPTWPQDRSAVALAALKAAPEGDARTAAAKLALAAEEDAYTVTAPADKSLLLPDMAKSAFLAGDLKKATDYARLALNTVPANASAGPAGNASHDGHMVLGRVAAAQGDLAGAATELLAAGRTPGSPQLTALGPNMSLARDLLVAGRRDAVVTYLEECAKFWDSPVLRQWQAEVAAGRTPDFGGSLRS